LPGIVGVWTGAILLTVGLSVALLVGECFAAFDARLANLARDPPGSLPTIEGYLRLMIVGVALAVVGTVLLMDSWLGPVRTGQIWTPYS
jgi:hypothetical protein